MIKKNIFQDWDLSLFEIPKGKMPDQIYKESISDKMSRKLNKNGRSVTSLIADARQYQMFAAESRGWEMALAYRLLFDSRVTIRRAQPYKFQVMRTDVNGVNRKTPCTPDYFVVLDTGEFIYIECKPLKKLQENPWKFTEISPGIWVDSAAVKKIIN